MLFNKNLIPSQDIVLVPNNGGWNAWNFRSSQGHKLSSQSIKVLIDEDLRIASPLIVQELKCVGLLQPLEDFAPSSWPWDVVSMMFHFGTMMKPGSSDAGARGQSAEAHLEWCASISPDMPADAFQTVRGHGNLPLEPRSDIHIEPILRVLEERRTTRAFAGGTMDFADVSLIIDEAFRYRPHDLEALEGAGLSTPTWRRSAPSGGSLQSCEAYVVALRVAGLGAGIYHYRSHAKNLGLVRPVGDEFRLGKFLADQAFADDLSAAIVISCRFDKLRWKYPNSRAYRVALFDAGHLSQTVQLLATALDLRTWVTAAFYDEKLNELLNLPEGSNEHALLVIGLGTGPVNAIDKNLQNPATESFGSN